MYRPWVNRKFGVEMELNRTTTTGVATSQRQIAEQVRAALATVGINRPVSIGGYTHSDGTSWDVKTDASCGWELAAPALMLNEQAENDELRAVTNRVALLKPQINRQCGLHVHVEVRDYDWRDMRNLIVLWARYEPYFFELCPPSRRVNSYCPPFRKTTWGGQNGGHWTRIEAAMANMSEREFRQAMMGATPRGSLNLAHLWQNRRVEFRLAAGTIEYEKVVRWTQLLLSLVARVKHTGMPTIQSGGWSDKGFPTMYVAKVLGLAPSKAVPAEEIPPESTRLVAWMEARRNKFRKATAARGSVRRPT
jgi:hypothetical protein